ncbi:MAG: 4-hydroxybenzoyl-CoA reductase subunit gamma [Planctomycetota bacterium]|jgi:xanthine dehydrogenase YagT iron-sulfur-binding subunit
MSGHDARPEPDAHDSASTTAGVGAQLSPSRRDLMRTSASAAAAGLVAPAVLGSHAAHSSQSTAPSSETLSGEIEIELSINGAKQRLKVEPRTTLLDALRNRANPPLTGSKLVCDRGNCGACSMIVGGKLVYGCLQLAVDARGKEVRTVEGLQRGDELSAVQRAFCEKDASMCGFCTPGFVMAITHCLENHPKADLERIKAACAGNLCRCGTQPHVFEAALSVAKGGAQ